MSNAGQRPSSKTGSPHNWWLKESGKQGQDHIDQAPEFTGTTGNDAFIAILDSGDGAEDATLNALDSLDGGAGTDTLQIDLRNDIGTVNGNLAGFTLANIENATIRSSGKIGDGVGTDLTTLTVANLAITQATLVNATVGADTAVTVSGVTGNVTVDGGASQTVTSAEADAAITLLDSEGNISVTHTAQGAGLIIVDDGADVTVTATGATVGDIAVGGEGDVTGAVVIDQTVESDGGEYTVSGAIDVLGGTSVTITQSGVIVAKDAAATSDLDLDTISVVSAGDLTDIVITRTADVTEFVVEEVEDVPATQIVTFKALADGESVTVNALTFTATKDLTAAQVAAAFANIMDDEEQDAGGPVANGYYSGDFDDYSGWNATSVSGAAVTFTNDNYWGSEFDAYDDNNVTLTTAFTAGTDEEDGSETGNDVNFGAFVIEDAAVASIANISVDGFSGESYIGAVDNVDALESLTLANGEGDVYVHTDAIALDVALDNVDIWLGLDEDGAAVKTLNITTSGDESYVNLESDATTALTIDGSADLELDYWSDLAALKTVTITGSVGVTMDASGSTVTSVNAAGTSGDNTIDVDATKATYTGGTGSDDVTLTAAGVTKAVSLGDGDDSLALFSGTSTLTAVVDGGAGTDTLTMAAADAATATALATFETKVTGFEKLELGALQQGDGALEVDLANMDDIDYVIVNGSASGALDGNSEQVEVTFKALQAGQQVVIEGNVVYTANANMTAAQVAAAVDNWWFADNANGTWYSATAVGETVTFTNDDTVDVALAISFQEFDPAPIANTTQGFAGVTEEVTFTFSDVGPGFVITINGQTMTAGGAGATAQEIAEAFQAEATVGNAVITGVAGAWTAAYGAGFATVTWTDDGGPQDTSLAYTNITPTNTIQGADPITESTTLTFKEMYAGQVLNVDGLTLTATGYLTAAEVALAFSTAATDPANGNLTGAYSVNFNGGAVVNGNQVVYTSATFDTNVTDIGITRSFAGGVLQPVVDTLVEGGSGAAELLISSMADGGTVELTSNNYWNDTVTVEMDDATGDTDSLNIVVGGYWWWSVGTVVADDVETFNISGAGGIYLEGDAVETINVVANEAIVVDGEIVGYESIGLYNIDADALTLIDASTSNGDVYAYTVNDGMTIKGGAGDDEIDVYNDEVTIEGGAGDDYINIDGSNLSSISGGEGADYFEINGVTTDVNSASEITDLGTGDIIEFVDGWWWGNNLDFVNEQVTLDPDGNPDLQNFANAAMQNSDSYDISWLQYNGNTYVVVNMDGNDVFNGGSDQIVKITGLVDLSTASFNTTYDTLEIA